jgi:hypothetical protein
MGEINTMRSAAEGQPRPSRAGTVGCKNPTAEQQRVDEQRWPRTLTGTDPTCEEENERAVGTVGAQIEMGPKKLKLQQLKDKQPGAS